MFECRDVCCDVCCDICVFAKNRGVQPNPESASASPFTPLPSMPAGWYFDKIAGAPGGNSEVISILVVGNTSVGKTCFCRKFARESDVQRAGPTVGGKSSVRIHFHDSLYDHHHSVYFLGSYPLYMDIAQEYCACCS